MPKKVLMDAYLFSELPEKIQAELIDHYITMEWDYADDFIVELCKEAVSNSKVLSTGTDIVYSMDRDILDLTVKGSIDISFLARHIIETYDEPDKIKEQLMILLEPRITDISRDMDYGFESQTLENYDISEGDYSEVKGLTEDIIEYVTGDADFEEDHPYYLFMMPIIQNWVEYFVDAAAAEIKKEVDELKVKINAYLDDLKDYDRVKLDLSEQSRIEQIYYDSHGSLVHEGGE